VVAPDKSAGRPCDPPPRFPRHPDRNTSLHQLFADKLKKPRDADPGWFLDQRQSLLESPSHKRKNPGKTGVLMVRNASYWQARYPLGDSNPCYRTENPGSWATRRRGRVRTVSRGSIAGNARPVNGCQRMSNLIFTSTTHHQAVQTTRIPAFNMTRISDTATRNVGLCGQRGRGGLVGGSLRVQGH